MSLPKALFFDWDGTLVDSYAFLEGAHNHVKTELGLPLFKEGEYLLYFGKPREYLYEQVYGEYATKAWELFEVYVQDNHAEKLVAMKDADKLLEAVHAIDIVCGVVTNKRPSLVQREVATFEWDKYFSAVVGAGEAEADKPSSAPLELALKRAGDLHKDDIWFVGDTEIDAQCARNLGCPFVVVHENCDHLEWVSDFKPVYAFRSCTQMRDFVLQTAGKSLKQLQN